MSFECGKLNTGSQGLKMRKTDFVRSVLCALLISLLFSFVASHVNPTSEEKIHYYGKLPACDADLYVFKAKFIQFIRSDIGGHLVYAGLWMVFYFGYLIDDYVHARKCSQEVADNPCLFLLVGGWFCFFGQVVAIWYLRLSALFGFAGLLLVTAYLCVARRGWWGLWFLENVTIAFFVLVPCILGCDIYRIFALMGIFFLPIFNIGTVMHEACKE